MSTNGVIGSYSSDADDIISPERLQAFRGSATRDEARGEVSRERFDELAESGYLVQAVPEELGGLGLSLMESGRQQRRLAYHAPGEALAVNSHLCWTGAAGDRWNAGDRTLEWLLREACAGEVFATATEPSPNPAQRGLPACTAERVDGGYCFTGAGAVGAPADIWTRLGVRGVYESDRAQKRLVQAFVPREAAGFEVTENMEAAAETDAGCHGIVLDAAFVPDQYVLRVVPLGALGADRLLLGFDVWEALATGNVHAGMALDAFDMALRAVGDPAARRPPGKSPPHAVVAEMAAELRAIEAHLEYTAGEWGEGTGQSDLWPAKAVMVREHAVAGAARVIDAAYGLAEGSGIFDAHAWNRLLRGARAGATHARNREIDTRIVADSYMTGEPGSRRHWN